MTRETAFLCTWITPEAEQHMYVRAWSEAEAIELLRAELRAANLPVPGSVRVSPASQARLGTRSAPVADVITSSE